MIIEVCKQLRNGGEGKVGNFSFLKFSISFFFQNKIFIKGKGKETKVSVWMIGKEKQNGKKPKQGA